MNEESSHLLTDVNLAAIGLSDDGRTVTIDFLNMEDGGVCARLVANGVVALNYHNVFVGEEDALPAYVGEVTVREVEKGECDSVLLRLGYGFLAKGVNTFISGVRHYLIHVEGGEIAVDLVCCEYRLDRC